MLLKSSRRWTDLDKYQLWLAYELKTPLLVLEEHFKRTVSSINKFLIVSTIRDKSDRYLKGGTPPVKIRTLEDLTKVLVECGLDKDTVGIEREITRCWKPSGFTMKKLAHYGLHLPCPWGSMQQVADLPIKSGIGRRSTRQVWVYVSMEVVINYLQRIGIDIRRLDYRNPFGWQYLVDNKPATDFICLMKANWEREKRREPIFLVKGVTVE